MDAARFSPFPALTTARLSLRRLSQADAEGIFALRSDPDVTRYTGIPQYTNLAQASDYIARMCRDTEEGKSVVWSIRLRDTDAFLGSVCLWNIAWDGGSVEIGYDLLPAHQGKGYMREAAAAVLVYGFSGMGLERIFADLRADNEKSVRLLQDSGFLCEKTYGLTEDEREAEMAVWALERAAWRAGHTAEIPG